MARLSCIINYLKVYEISDEVIKSIEETIKKWRVELTTGRKSLTEAYSLEMRYQHNYLC